MAVATWKTTTDEGEDKQLSRAKLVINVLSKSLTKLGLFFQWYVLQRLPVYYVHKPDDIAWTDGYGIYITDRFLEKTTSEQLFILRHELYHVILQHTEVLSKKLASTNTVFEKNIIKILHNIVSDAVVNGLILKEDQNLKLVTPIAGYVNPNEVSRLLDVEDVTKLGFVEAVDKLSFLVARGDIEVRVVDANNNPVDISNEPIERLLKRYGGTLVAVVENKKNGSRINVGLVLDNKTGTGGGGGKKEGDESEEGGEPEAKKVKDSLWGDSPKTPEDIRKLVADAAAMHKRLTSGMPAAGLGQVPGVEYALTEVGVKRPEWEALLVENLSSIISKNAVVSWHFINRAAPGIKPGVKYLQYPDIHILLDVSGSMLGGTLEKALMRVLYIVERYPDVKVFLYQWSDGVSLPQEINRKFAEDVRRYKKLRIDTGGTRIEPALDLVLQKVTSKDCVIILTDGYIFDIDDKRVIEKLDRLSKQAGKVIFASLGYIPETLPDSVVKIKLED